ncbi:MAG: RHS repeat protein, partial [Chloroflexi bacterium]|nr:RHS repeat protein [Chloroflexota bacterium]
LENEAQQIEWLGGTLNANRTWANEVDAYVVLATINVPDNVSLTLEPGTVVLFANPATMLNVAGVLVASGTPEASIYFGRTADLGGKWSGISLGGGTLGDSDSSHLAYAVFQDALTGLFINSSMPALEYLTFLDNDVGLRVNNSGGLIVSNSNFRGNVHYGLENETLSQPVTAVNNYWGAGGPHHDTQYPSNGGDAVSDGVEFAPWRTTPVPFEGSASFIASRTETDHTTLVYDSDTGIYTRYYPDGGEVRFDALGRHAYTLYPDGRTLNYVYNPDGTTASMNIIAPGESVPHWTWTFNYVDGKLGSITDPAGRTTDFTINGSGQLTAVAFPDGSGESFFYDSRSLLTQHTDQNGDVSGYAYDEFGRIQTDTRPIRSVYDPDTGQVGDAAELRAFTPSETAYPLLNQSAIGDPDNPAPAALMSADLVDEIAFGRGSLSGHTNKWGSWTAVSDATGRATQYERDEANNITRQTYPSGDCDVFTYDETGHPLAASRMSAADCALETPLNAQTVNMTYEPRFNQVKSITDPDGNTTTYFYDYEVDPNDGILTDDHLLARIEYPPVADETGQMVTPTTQYAYNSWGLLETETDAAGKTTRYVYTQVGDTALFRSGVTPVPGLLTQVIEGDGTANPLTTTYRDFNAQEYAETIIRPGGTDIASYAYDDMGRVISETNAVGTTTVYEYDAQGNLTRRVDDYTADGVSGFNIVTTYEYDADNQLTYQEQAAAGLVSFTDYVPDINGNPAQQGDELGYGATSLYDDADRLVNRIDAAGQTITYTHDVNGRVESVVNSDGTVGRTEYDGFNRVARSISNWVDGVYDPNHPDEDIITGYQYDDRNNTVVVTDTLGQMTRTFYDDLNRVTGSIANWTPGTTLADCAALPLLRDHDICSQTAYDEVGRTIIVTDTL